MVGVGGGGGGGGGGAAFLKWQLQAFASHNKRALK